jgi:hypothetical protein
MTETIRTIRVRMSHAYAPDRVTYRYYAGKHKRNSNQMTFTDKPHLAVRMTFSTPEEELQLLQDAESSMAYSSTSAHAEWVDLTTTTVVEVLSPSDEFMELLRVKLITNFSPVELKALGLTGQAVHLKLMKE